MSRTRFEERVRSLLAQLPALRLPIEPLLEARHGLMGAHAVLQAEAKRLAKADRRCTIVMSMPGVGPLSALAFVSALDGADRFAGSSSVGAYLGLTPRGHQSGDVSWSGRISKQGDGLTRGLLYEAANSLMYRVKVKAAKASWPPEKLWARKLADRAGGKKARVALARKMAVIPHRMLIDNRPYDATANRQGGQCDSATAAWKERTTNQVPQPRQYLGSGNDVPTGTGMAGDLESTCAARINKTTSATALLGH